MLKNKFNEMLRRKSFKENRNITVNVIVSETGIGYATVSKLKNRTDGEHYFSTATLEKLCVWFECEVSDLIEYIPDKK